MRITVQLLQECNPDHRLQERLVSKLTEMLIVKAYLLEPIVVGVGDPFLSVHVARSLGVPHLFFPIESIVSPHDGHTVIGALSPFDSPLIDRRLANELGALDRVNGKIRDARARLASQADTSLWSRGTFSSVAERSIILIQPSIVSRLHFQLAVQDLSKAGARSITPTALFLFKHAVIGSGTHDSAGITTGVYLSQFDRLCDLREQVLKEGSDTPGSYHYDECAFQKVRTPS